MEQGAYAVQLEDPLKSSSQLGLQGSQEMKDTTESIQARQHEKCLLTVNSEQTRQPLFVLALGSGVSSSRLRLLGSSGGKRYLWAHPRLFSLNVAKASLVAIVSDSTEKQ